MSTSFQQSSRSSVPKNKSNRFRIDSEAWSAAAAYLPDILVDSIRTHPRRNPPWIELIEGTLVMADVSGFTSMSERLATAGKEGAEWLTDIINQYFNGMLDIARNYGGVNIKFGGDALLLLFRGRNHAVRAIAASSAMQRSTRNLKAFRIGNFRNRVSMTLGAHSGSFWFAVAGLPEQRMQHFLLGRETNLVAEAEAMATRGELVITDTTFTMAKEFCQAVSLDGSYRVLKVSSKIKPIQIRRKGFAQFSSAHKLLAYLPPPVAQRLIAGDNIKRIEGEHRKVVILFVNILNINELLDKYQPGDLLDELQRYVSKVVQLTENYGGFLASNDIYTHGLKLILVFGAPIAHEDDSANALRFALELSQELDSLKVHFRHRIGINSGHVFAGDVGSYFRRQYTVMGDAVNLSARLMSAASPDQILVSKWTTEEAGPSFVVQELSPIQVKGKKEPIPIGLLKGERSIPLADTGDQSGRLFGRDAELDLFRRILNKAKAGHSQTVVISGIAGIGKSRLTLEFQKQLEVNDWTIISGACYSYTAAKPFSPWVQILNTLLNVDISENIAVRTRQALVTMERIDSGLKAIASLLNSLLDLAIPESDIVRSLKEEQRRSRLFELVLGLLKGAVSDLQLAIFITDLHWADSSSVELINYIANTAATSRLLICVSHRPKKGLGLNLTHQSTTVMTLDELDRDAATEFAQIILERPQLPDHIAEFIYNKTRGNPLFLEELARTVRQSGNLERLLAMSPTQLEKGMDLEIPDRLQSLIMSRIDGLSDFKKDILRSAAVIGGFFDISSLSILLGEEVNDTYLKNQLQELVQLDIAYQVSDEPEYQIKQTLVQEVAYNSLLFARRRKLHHQYAGYLEGINENKLEAMYEILVYHYARSDDNTKTQIYSLKAGQKARQVFATDEAISYYRLGLDTIKEATFESGVKRSYFSECVADCYEVSGRHEESSQELLRAIQEWRSANRRNLKPPLNFAIDSDTEVKLKGREALLSHKISVSYERNSDYDNALKWLDRAQEVIPRGQSLLAAKINITRSVALFRKGLYEEAISWGRRGLSLSRRSSDPAQLAYAHNMLASSYVELGRLKQAIQHRQSSILIYEQTGDLPGLAVANNNLGLCYQLLGELNTALAYYEKGLEIDQRIGNQTAVAILHNNIGEVLLIQGDLDGAIYHLSQVVETYNRTGDPLAATGLALVNLSRAYQGKGVYEDAEISLERGKSLLRKAGARGLLFEARLQQVELNIDKNNIQVALRLCRRLLKDVRLLGMKLIEARGLRLLGCIMVRKGQLESADEYLAQSMGLAERLDAEYERGLAILSINELYLNQKYKGRLHKRRQFFIDQAVGIFQRMGAQHYLSQAEQLKYALSDDNKH